MVNNDFDDFSRSDSPLVPLHEPEKIDALFTEDAVYGDVAGGRLVHGRAAIKQLLRAAYAWALDFRVARNRGTD